MLLPVTATVPELSVNCSVGAVLVVLFVVAAVVVEFVFDVDCICCSVDCWVDAVVVVDVDVDADVDVEVAAAVVVDDLMGYKSRTSAAAAIAAAIPPAISNLFVDIMITIYRLA